MKFIQHTKISLVGVPFGYHFFVVVVVVDVCFVCLFFFELEFLCDTIAN